MSIYMCGGSNFHPYECSHDNIHNDWKMCYNKDNTTYYAPEPKPSLLTRIKRIGRSKK